MIASLPPMAPPGDHRMVEAFNALRQYIITNQLAGIKGGSGLPGDIETTPSGRIVRLVLPLQTGGPPPALGACCVDTFCSIQTAAACAGLGGTYQGDGTGCTPNPCLCQCHRVTTINTSYAENHYYYPCGTCTPDFGDSVSSSNTTEVLHLDCFGNLLSADCAGGSSSVCTGGYGCFCPPNEGNQCRWGTQCNGTWVNGPPGTGCHMDNVCTDYNCNHCAIGCNCYPCPYGTLVCVPRPECNAGGNDCYVFTWLNESHTAWCWRSLGYCNQVSTVIEPCP